MSDGIKAMLGREISQNIVWPTCKDHEDDAERVFMYLTDHDRIVAELKSRAFDCNDCVSSKAQLSTITKLENELETERLRLAGCGVAALMNTQESKTNRITRDNPYWSASYRDVCDMVDREIELREENVRLREALSEIIIMNPTQDWPTDDDLHYAKDIARKALARDEAKQGDE